MQNQTETLAPGTVIRGPERSYTIIKVLGQGGFGITYLVSGKVRVGNIVVDVRFAMKEHFISSLCSRDGATKSVQFSAPVADQVGRSMKAFIKESRRLQSLGIDHPNVVRINEVFEANNTAYYVMEYIEGASLQDYVRKHGPMSADAAKALLQPLIEAVATLHSNSIAHYDIKPANIMLSEEADGSLRPVLIDFGLAKHYDDAGQATSSIAAAGYSPGYAPLEQYAGISSFSPRCDVYALAATLYFCVTGHAPKAAQQLRSDEVRRDLEPILGSQDTDLIVRSLSIIVENRPADAGELSAALYGDALMTQTRIEPQKPVTDETTRLMPAAAPKASRPFPIRAAIIAVSIIVVAVIAWLLINPSAEVPNQPAEQVAVKPDPDPDPDPEPITDYRNLDLQASRDGRNYYFSQSEWADLPQSEKSKYSPKGVVVIGDGLEFVLALHDNGKGITWYEAMRTYGNSLPTKAQGEVLAAQTGAVMAAVKAFGGDDPMSVFWTRTEYDSSYAWFVGMNCSHVSINPNETNAYRARSSPGSAVIGEINPFITSILVGGCAVRAGGLPANRFRAARYGGAGQRMMSVGGA